MDRIVVVGAGLAGLGAAEELRRQGFERQLVLLGDEPHDPYDRPPLSKQFLAGEWGEERLYLRKPERLAELALEHRRGVAAGLDLSRKVVHLAEGEELSYDGLVLATGSRARRLPAFEGLAGAHVLRSLEDALLLRRALLEKGRLLVVGAGFIGMEVAATARGLGCRVSVVEPLEAPLLRALGPAAGAACAELHRRQGVELHLGVGVGSVTETAEGRLVVELADKSRLEADAAVVGVGAVPNVGWLEGSGLEVGPGGVACDARLVAAPSVVVAGDIARFPFGPSRAAVRLEHRTNAAEQGPHAARSLLGEQADFETVPYVWSDQYDQKIQLLGLPEPDDEMAVVEGELESGRFLALYGRGSRLVGAVGFSMPRALMAVRNLLLKGASFEEALGARP